VVVGIIEVSQAVWLQTTLSHATREGARYAIVHGQSSIADDAGHAVGPSTFDPTGGTNLTPIVNAAAVGVDSAGRNVTNTWAPENKRGSAVTVAASAPSCPSPRGICSGAP